MRIRLALDDEAEIFVGMVRETVAEASRPQRFDADVTRETFRQYLETSDPTIWFAERDGVVVGYSVVSVGQFRYSSCLYILQEVIWVRPDNRGTRAAALLTKNLIAEAERRGIPEIIGGNDSGVNPELSKRFLEHFGFETVGYCMRRQV